MDDARLKQIGDGWRLAENRDVAVNFTASFTADSGTLEEKGVPLYQISNQFLTSATTETRYATSQSGHRCS